MYNGKCLYTEDIIANALIAKAEIQGVRIITPHELEEYAKTCQHIAKTRHNCDVTYGLTQSYINETKQHYADYFLFHTNGNIEILPGIDTVQLRRKFRPSLSIDTIRCYTDASECFRPGNQNMDHMVLDKTTHADWCEQTTVYMLLTTDKRVEFYDIVNRNQAKGLLKNLAPGSQLYCITAHNDKPRPLIVTDIMALTHKLQELIGY